MKDFSILSPNTPMYGQVPTHIIVLGIVFFLLSESFSEYIGPCFEGMAIWLDKSKLLRKPRNSNA